MSQLLIYGANGYTGELIAREAVRRGISPILAGRSEEVTSLANELGVPSRIFPLDAPERIVDALSGLRVVLNCAGPFSQTACPLAEACLRTSTSYLDITGEIGVFESLAAHDSQARDAEITLLPGVGFDVVPTDCLAAHLKRRLPTATQLRLAFQALSRISRGTARTMIENLHRGGMVRKGGNLQAVPAAWKPRQIDFGDGPLDAITIPWGDVSTVYYSTGIGDIEVYTAVPWALRAAALASRFLIPLMEAAPFQTLFHKFIASRPAGPTAEERAAGRSHIWGEVSDESGTRAVSRLHGPEAYSLTVQTALTAAERVLAGSAPTGFQTPSTAFGVDFILDIPGVDREDVTAN